MYKSTATKTKKATSIGHPRRHRQLTVVNPLARLRRDQIKRLARVAGVVRVSSEVYDDVRVRIAKIVDSFVKDAVIYTDYMRHKIITSKDMLSAWQRNYGQVYGAALPDKHCPLFKKRKTVRRVPAGKRALQEVMHYQKQADCMHFPRSAFDALVRSTANVYGTGVKLSKDAVTVAQVCVEGLVVHMLAMAQLAAIHDGERKTILPRDLELVQSFMNQSMTHCPASIMATQ